MKLNKIMSALSMQNTLNRNIYASSLAALLLATPTYAAEPEDTNVEVIEVTGIRSSLASAMLEKKSANNLIEVIRSIDFKLLDYREDDTNNCELSFEVDSLEKYQYLKNKLIKCGKIQKSEFIS